MTLDIQNFERFYDENFKLVQETLANQFEKHFNLLVEAVPDIDSFEWVSSQEDEMVFSLVYFTVTKNNGYVFKYCAYNTDDDEALSNKEFNAKEIELIIGFKDYLDGMSRLIVNLWGSETFKLEKDKPDLKSSCQKIKM